METKSRIKVIKRSQQQPKSVVKTVKHKTKTAQSAAREMVATVTDWVTEFQQKRRDETQDALNKFFPPSPNPSGCGNF